MDDERMLSEALAGARRRAAQLEASCDLTLSTLKTVAQRQHGRCALSGLTFSDRAVQGAPVVYPFAPCVVRIRPDVGYVADNVRLAAQIAVYIRDHWDADVVAQLLAASPETLVDSDMQPREVARLHRAANVSDTLDQRQPEPTWARLVRALIPGSANSA